jgi:hypothetical protein
MRYILTCLAAAAVLASGAAPARAGEETLREQSEKVEEPAGLTAIEVDNARGQIDVRPSADGKLHIRALKIVRAPDNAKAREIANQIRVAVSRQDGRYLLKVTYPQRQVVHVGFWEMMSGDVQLPRSEMRLALDVPAEIPVSLHSTSGDLSTDMLAGVQRLETTSGDAEVRDSRGPVTFSSTSGDLTGSFGAAARVRTVSGDVEVDRAGGPLDVHTTSGDITVRDAADSLLLGTVSGDIEVGRAANGLNATTTSGTVHARGLGGRCQLETSSGDVEASLTRGISRADFESGSGDITVRFGPGVGAALEVRTSNGTIDASVPIEVKSVTRRLLTGKVGSGQTPVLLRSSSGDIQILSGGE